MGVIQFDVLYLAIAVAGMALLQGKQSTYSLTGLLFGVGLLIVNILGMVGVLPR